MDIEFAEIELLDDRADRASTVEKSSALPKLIAALGALFVGWLAVGVLTPDTAHPRQAFAKSASPSTSDLWPDPPEDHDPHYFGFPSAGTSLLAERTDLTLVYVNSLGRPTVIDLDTGYRTEVDVATTRTHERFRVAFGDVPGVNLRNRNIAGTTERAITFHVVAENNDPLSVTDAPGPILCVDASGCQTAGWSVQSLSNGPDSVEPLSADTHPELHAMVFGDWPIDGRYLTVTTVTGESYRLPRLLNDQVWVLHQPVPDAWPDLGRELDAFLIGTTLPADGGESIVRVDLDTGHSTVVELPTQLPGRFHQLAEIDGVPLLFGNGLPGATDLDVVNASFAPNDAVPSDEPITRIRGGLLVGEAGATNPLFVDDSGAAPFSIDVPDGLEVAGVTSSGIVLTQTGGGEVEAWRDGERQASVPGVLLAVHGEQALWALCRSSGCEYRVGAVGGESVVVAASATNSVQNIEPITWATADGVMAFANRTAEGTAIIRVDMTTGETERFEGFSNEAFRSKPWVWLPDYSGLVGHDAIADLRCRCLLRLDFGDQQPFLNQILAVPIS